MNTRKIILFLLFAFGISWLTAALLYVFNVRYGSLISVVFVAVFFMGAPAFSAMFVQKKIYKQPIKDLGFDFKNTFWKKFLWIPVLYILVSAFFIFLVYLLGNKIQVFGIGYFSLDQDLFDQKMQEMMLKAGSSAPQKIPLAPIALLIISILSAALFGGIINGLFTLGEELGWRGFLYNELRPLGFIKSNLLVGTIWGLWHMPIILQGHNYPEHPVAGVFMMIIFCVPLAFLMSYVRLKTNSVIAPALLHGMVNAGAGGIMLMCYEYNDLIGNIAGLVGGLAIAILVIIILLIDRKSLSGY